MPRRIIVVSHYYPAHRGGVEAVALIIASRLSRIYGRDIVWFASDIDSPPSHDVPSNLSFAAARTCNILEKRLGLPWPLWSFGDLVRLWRAVREAYAVHIHDFIYLGSIVACIAAWVYRKPVLLTQHIGFIPYRSRFLRALLELTNRSVGSWSMRRATQVVFVSAAVQAYFSRFVAWKRPPILIPNGIGGEAFRPVCEARRTELRFRHGIPQNNPVFLFVGRFTEKKGLPMIKKLIGSLRDVQWIIVGHGEDEPEQWGFGNLRVYRDLSSTDLAPLYQLADLLVLPSRGEGFPLVVQESMACATPAIVSDETAAGAPAAAEFLFNEPVGEDGDDERWRLRLESFLKEPNALAGMRKLVSEFARRAWGVDGCVARYNQILDEIAGGDSNART